VTLSISASRETGKATVEFTTVPGCSHTLEKAEAPNSPNWVVVETLNGDGNAHSREFDLIERAEYYRVVNGN
jgi:hypothetical protein